MEQEKERKKKEKERWRSEGGEGKGSRKEESQGDVPGQGGYWERFAASVACFSVWPLLWTRKKAGPWPYIMFWTDKSYKGEIIDAVKLHSISGNKRSTKLWQRKSFFLPPHPSFIFQVFSDACYWLICNVIWFCWPPWNASIGFSLHWRMLSSLFAELDLNGLPHN